MTRAFLVFISALLCTADAFTASLVRPWETPPRSKGRSASPIRLHVSQLQKSQSPSDDQNDEKDPSPDARAEMKSIEDEAEEESFILQEAEEEEVETSVTAHAVSMSSHHGSVTSMGQTPLNGNSEQHSKTTPHAVTEAKAKPNVLSCLPDLFAMTRPSNLPGVVLFHMLGLYLVIPPTTNFWKTFVSPSMLITLAALLLTSASSMLVNDYYDFKLGNDSTKAYQPLSTQKVPLPVARRFLSYLYSAALICVTMVPGSLARMTVVTGLMLTFWYTQHLKPRTWLKNVVCAGLIALSPLTSGVAALSALGGSYQSALPLIRVVSMLFVGILGREITMDINDVQDDTKHGVRTVPAVYGRKFASCVALACSIAVAGLALGTHLRMWVVGGMVAQDILFRRIALAGLGSAAQLRRSYQVYQSQGQDSSIVSLAVDEGLLSVVLLLASFV